MDKQVFEWIDKNNMFGEAKNVIVAFSGGADSMALLHFLHSNKKRWGFCLSAAHFEHGLRGEESVKDAEFVQKICTNYGIVLHFEAGNMANRQKPAKMGTEEWARELRYAFFRKLAAENGALIALAHSLSDNAETVLFRAARGTGVLGLGGIPPKRDCFVRPILTVTRPRVEDYCKQHNLQYVQDATNMDNSFSRNRLRNEVMPLLKKAHPGAEAGLARLAQDMRGLDAWLLSLANIALKSAETTNLCGKIGYIAKILLENPEPVRLRSLAVLAGKTADRAALCRMEEVLMGNAKKTQLPGKKIATLRQGILFIEPTQSPQKPQNYQIELAEGEYLLPSGQQITVKVLKNAQDLASYEKNFKKGLPFLADYGKILNCSVFRTRRAKDTFAPKGRGLTKPLNKWMNEQGIPPLQRDMVPILAQGSKVLWVLGGGFCQSLQATKNTSQWLAIHCKDKQDES